MGARSEREQQWAVEAVYPKGNRPERGHGRGCQESGAVAQPTTSEMSRIQAACQGIRRVPSGGIGECRTSKLNSRFPSGSVLLMSASWRFLCGVSIKSRLALWLEPAFLLEL